MACTITLTKSRKLPCISTKVGIKAIYVTQFNRMDPVVTSSTGVVSLPLYITDSVTPTVARYDVKATTINLTETLTNNLDTRSGGRKGELPVVIIPSSGVDSVTWALELEQISKTETLVFIEMKNGDFYAIGSQQGCMINTAVDTTGGQSGDLNGTTVTISTDEGESYRKYLLTSTAVTELITATLPDA